MIDDEQKKATEEQAAETPTANGESELRAEEKPGANGSLAEPPANDDSGFAAPTPEEHEELKDRLLRTLAEMENLRRRSQRELEDGRKYAVTSFARDLLEVSDNLRRGLEAVPDGAAEQSEYLRNLIAGIEMTERSLHSIFERHNIKQVRPERGERFDHNRHQAMFEVPTRELAPGTVAETMQVGYVIADRLLRPALVGVAKAAGNDEAASQSAEPEAQATAGQKIDTTA